MRCFLQGCLNGNPSWELKCLGKCWAFFVRLSWSDYNDGQFRWRKFVANPFTSAFVLPSQFHHRFAKLTIYICEQQSYEKTIFGKNAFFAIWNAENWKREGGWFVSLKKFLTRPGENCCICSCDEGNSTFNSDTKRRLSTTRLRWRGRGGSNKLGSCRLPRMAMM